MKHHFTRRASIAHIAALLGVADVAHEQDAAKKSKI
jgi:hypothetical protein